MRHYHTYNGTIKGEEHETINFYIEARDSGFKITLATSEEPKKHLFMTLDEMRFILATVESFEKAHKIMTGE